MTIKKTLKILAVIADNRNFNSEGFSVTLSKLTQSISVIAIRGTLFMILVRSL